MGKPAGNWLQLLMVLFTQEYVPVLVLCFLVHHIFPANRSASEFILIHPQIKLKIPIRDN